MIANLVVVPLLGLLIVQRFALSPEIATGVLLMAIAPGVPGVLIEVKKKGGSLNMAVALAVILPVLSALTIPITSQLVLPREMVASVPVGKFAMNLVLFQLFPLFVGVLLASRFGERVAPLRRILQAIFAVSVFLLLILIMPRIISAVSTVYGERAIVASLCLVLASLVTGYLCGGADREERRVLAIGTMLRNVGLSAIVATTCFSGDVVVASVLTYFIVQLVVSVLVSVYFVRTAAA